MAIDTSSILFAYENKIDPFKLLIENGYTPVISKGVINELKRIANSASRKRGYAKIALKVIQDKRIKVEGSEAYVDSWILKSKMHACTNDKKLKQLLKRKGAFVVSISRGGKLR